MIPTSFPWNKSLFGRLCIKEQHKKNLYTKWWSRGDGNTRMLYILLKGQSFSCLKCFSPPYCCFVFRSSYYWEKNNLLIPFRWLNVTVLLSMIWYRCSIYSWEIFIGMPMDAWLGVFFSYHLKILKTRSCVPCFEPGQSWEFQHFPEFNCSNRSTTRGLTFILNFKQTPNEAPVKQQSYSCSWVVLYAHIRQKSQDMMLHIQLFLVFLLAKVSLFACEYIFQW